MEAISARAQKELVLLHQEDVKHPTGTVQWLNALGWVSSYFHVRASEEGLGQRGHMLWYPNHSPMGEVPQVLIHCFS